MSDDAPVLLEHDEGVSILTVNRPKALNALNEATLGAMGVAIEELGRRSQLRCLLITGSGDKAFVAGADIEAMRTMTPERGRRFSERGLAVFAAIENLPVPVIAVVNGFALGGGCELAMACDFAYASNKAKFGQPEIKLGILPGFGGTQRLGRRVGPGMARELVFTGRMIGPEEALRIGLVNAVYPRQELMVRARETANTIAEMAPLAMAAAKRVMLDGAHRSLDEGTALEAEAFGACFESEDQSEGMGAFLEKRAPVFRGR